jgi:hypothetical protein
MKRVLLYGCLGILVLTGFVSTIIFVVLYITSQNDIKIKNAELALCLTNNTNNCVPTQNESESIQSTEQKFVDAGQNINIDYPSSWVGELDTSISTDFAYEPIYGRVIEKYDFNLTKSATTLKFSKILGGVDGFPDGIKSVTHDWVEISGTDLVRVSDKGANKWRYVEMLNCATLGEPFFTPAEVASFDLCIGSFFPGFGTLGASSVSINSSNSVLLEEADLIVKSALN